MKIKGVSLIVLVITIVVVIILAAAVILNLGKNNPINDAKKAKIAQTIDNFKSDLAIQVANKLLKDNSISIKEINSREEEGWRITDLIPSIRGTEYEDDFIVENGKLKLKEGTTLPEETQNIIKEYLGEKVEGGNIKEEIIITKEIINQNLRKYIGKSVTYTGYYENTNIIDWKIYGFDEDGNIMLRANDYIDLSYKSIISDLGITINGYKIYSSNKDRNSFINFLSTSSNWSEYAVEGKTQARGAMTLPEFVNGYNLVNEEKLAAEYLTAGATSSDNMYTASVDGYAIKKGDGNYSYIIGGIKELTDTGMKFYNTSNTNAEWMWLASASSDKPESVVYVDWSARVYDFDCDREPGGIFPIVSLTSAVLVEKIDGTITVE